MHIPQVQARLCSRVRVIIFNGAHSARSEEDKMSDDANTMRPDATFTSVTNAKTADRPKLSLSGPDPRPDSDYDPEQLKAGVDVEMEHTDDPAVAKKITKDHLDEIALYYKYLKEMEDEHKNDEVKGRLE
jgi:hypothetical protein